MEKRPLFKPIFRSPRGRALRVPQSYLTMMNPNPSNSASLISFFDLPLEIRHQIYHHCLVHSEPISIGSLYYSKLEPPRIYEVRRRNILLLCRQIYHEAAEITYENDFLLFSRDDAMMSVLKPAEGFDLFKVRHLIIIIEPQVDLLRRGGENHQLSFL